MKPPKDLRSKFELKMAAKIQAEEDEQERKRLEENRAQIEVFLWFLIMFTEIIRNHQQLSGC